MADWHGKIAQVAEAVEHRVDKARRTLKHSLGWKDPLLIRPYIGFANGARVFLHGRVLEEEGIRSPVKGDTAWDNLRMMYRRFESDEIPNARVAVETGGTTQIATTDREGFFRCELEMGGEPRNAVLPWNEARFRLLDPLWEHQQDVRATGRFINVLPQTRFGVISDIDDTVVHTDNSSLVRMARIVYLGNARTRLPFAGVTEFYKALSRGVAGNEQNPIFYVSSSPWNLYDLFHDFLEVQNIPLGPLMLRDWGITAKELLPRNHAQYKLDVISHILEFYPTMPFLLIGDSGQEDPEIYCKLVEKYGGQILGAYIRQVGGRESRIQTIQDLFDRASVTGTDLEVVPDTQAAARHAAGRGWIHAEALRAVAAEVERDRADADSESDIIDDRKDR